MTSFEDLIDAVDDWDSRDDPLDVKFCVDWAGRIQASQDASAKEKADQIAQLLGSSMQLHWTYVYESCIQCAAR